MLIGMHTIMKIQLKVNGNNLSKLYVTLSKTFKIKQQKEPWITAPLIEPIKDKDYALKSAKKRNDPQL